MNKVNVRAYCIRPIFTAIIALAIAFTFNACSSGDDCTGDECGNGGNNNGGNNNGGGISNGAGSFSGLQAYTNQERKEQIYHFEYTRYNGSGDIEVELCYEYDSYFGECENSRYTYAGEIKDGIVRLQLPSAIDDEYLTTIDKALRLEVPPNCNIPVSLKAMPGRLGARNMAPAHPSCGNEGGLDYMYYYGDEGENVLYLYSSEAAKISCEYEGGYFEDVTFDLNLNLAKGWNEIYHAVTETSFTVSTSKSILKHQSDMKWSWGC